MNDKSGDCFAATALMPCNMWLFSPTPPRISVLAAAEFQPPAVHPCMVIKLNAAWFSMRQHRVDPSRAQHRLVPPSPSSLPVLAHIIPHSLPVKGPKTHMPVAHANVPGWNMEQRAGETEGDRPMQRRYSIDRQPPTGFESWVNKCPVYSGQGALTLATRHACIKPSGSRSKEWKDPLQRDW